MSQVFKAFLKLPTTRVGIITAVLFQLIFTVVWMTGYQGITDRIDRLNVAIVNEDEVMGAAIVKNLQENLPVGVQTGMSLAEAQDMLQSRDVQMIVEIPADFTSAAQSQEPAKINYLINESNPVTIKNMMTSIADNITATVNKQAVTNGLAGILSSQAKLPEGQAQSAAAVVSQRVVSNVESVNTVQGMNNQMVPMMMVLASYVGAMIMGQNFQISSKALGARFGRWPRMAVRLIVTAASSVIVSLVGTSLVAAFGGQMAHGFLALWGFQALFLLTFMFVAQMFLFVFDMGGMLFNIVVLSVQLVSSGAMMPRELLPDFYHSLGVIFPATYAVEGLMNTLFGGPGIGADAAGLLIILVVSLALIVVSTALRRDKAPVPPVVAAAEA
ncbi:ABC transporter permease [Saccharibacillus sp. CPCC 101409]|uniref:YhgE/Pip domain-containing protein n=1 Tax=Saccharibacillus sp. CPCC 101409 TaxID=3058041 RepID=UPI0026738EB7|nr:ABC transporter permease [Saccharibacillus sp. CPCC 101409]MDO3411216.1 ABC transporter permease [Saccharibacillus sp. CPCC 101409]